MRGTPDPFRSLSCGRRRTPSDPLSPGRGEGVEIEYVTKLGAYGLTVAAAFAVALAVLLSVSTTQTAEAQIQTKTGDTFAELDAATRNGDTRYIQHDNADGYVQFDISTTGSASASFTHSSATNDGQTIICSDADDEATGSCDADPAGTGVTVALKVDADSGAGVVFIKQTRLTGTGGLAEDNEAFEVTVRQVVGSVSITADTTTVPASVPADGGRAIVTITVKDNSSDKKPIASARVNVITTNGLFDHGTLDNAEFVQSTADDACLNTQLCQLTTDTAGKIILELRGSNRPASGTLTASIGDETASKDFVFSGSARNLAAEVEQDSVELDGKVFVVFTVTDSGDNPVKGAQPIGTAKNDIVGPAENATPVVLSPGVPKMSKGKVVIPACGDKAEVDQNDNGDLTDEGDSAFVPGGTNASGQCVIQVHAPADVPTTPANEAAMRGTWTLNFRLSTAAGADTASVSLEVAGAPASITTNAPDRVDPGSQTEITVTVFDDEDVKVGITNVTVRKVDGGGLIEGHDGAADANGDAIPNTEKTSDGQSTFTYIAPSSDGAVELLVTAGKASRRVSLNIGEAMPEEPDMPAMPDGDATLMVQGNLGSFSGGSVDALAAAANAACPGGSQIAVQDGDGEWNLWSSTAPAFALIGFTTTFADGFGAGTLVWVTSCEADAMDSEGSMGSEG